MGIKHNGDKGAQPTASIGMVRDGFMGILYGNNVISNTHLDFMMLNREFTNIKLGY